jgi:hypothetical protein
LSRGEKTTDSELEEPRHKSRLHVSPFSLAFIAGVVLIVIDVLIQSY